MYIVIGLNQSEYGRGNSRPVHKFETQGKLMSFLLTYAGDVSRLEIYNAKQMKLNINLEELE